MAAFGPYSPIFRAGDLYFVSGQLGINPETKEAGADIIEQTHLAMRNLQGVLGQEGLDVSHLAQTTLYLARVSQLPLVNKIYESYFDPKAPKPARETIGVSELPDVADRPLLIEIAAVAYKAG